MLAKPKIAFVGRPSEVEIDSGRAKNARYARLLPSIRNSSRGVSPLPWATVLRLVIVRARTCAERAGRDRYAGGAASRCFDAPGRPAHARTFGAFETSRTPRRAHQPAARGPHHDRVALPRGQERDRHDTRSGGL